MFHTDLLCVFSNIFKQGPTTTASLVTETMKNFMYHTTFLSHKLLFLNCFNYSYISLPVESSDDLTKC